MHFSIPFVGASGATISVINDCGFTVWPGISGSPVLNITGFELAQGKTQILRTPEIWQGQIWGRTGCAYNRSGHLSCKTGDCGSGDVECNGRSATPPFTLAEFKATRFKDYYYDVSLTNGYNLQMTMEATGGSVNSILSCMKTGCVDDLSKRCPMELMLEGGGGCQSACQVFDKPEYCCGSLPCKPTLYSRLFNSACPRSYSAGFFYTSYWCDSANYTVRFCPPADTFSTIKVGRQVNYYDQLVSIRGNFTLGFFDSDGSYLGIWYTGDAKARKVWVANPNKPIISTSAGIIALSIDPNTRNLIITTGGRTLMNITDVQAGPYPNVTATLEDTGNFRLINEIDKKVLWQSFDHPTNVLLPGMKLGFNKTTGQNWTLTSRLSKEIPGTGAFTLSMEPDDYNGVQALVIRRRGQPYWRSGYLFHQISFEDVFALYHPGRQPYYTLTSVNNADSRGWYLSYESSYLEFPMWILTPEGRITDDDSSVFWTPEFCYGYNSSNGCVESSLPYCRRETDNFDEKYGEFDPGMTSATDSNSSLSISDCFNKCWNDCGCVGFKSHTIDGTGCDFWRGSNSYLVYPNGSSESNSGSKYVINSLNLISSGIGKKTKRNMKWIYTSIGVAIPSVFLCLVLLWYTKKRKQTQEENQRRKRDEYFLELTASESFKDVQQLEGNARNGKDLLLFSFASIMAATSDFSIENKLGQGGFGPVYKVYAMEGTFSMKSDIFSFGVLILEIISGRRNSSFVHSDRTYNLIGYAWELWQQGNALQLEDPTLGSTCDVQQLLRTVHVALLCVQESAMDRPTTSDMISMLLNDTTSLPAPKRPAFFNGTLESNSTPEHSEPDHYSVNNMTITVMEGRK
ncbi:hypothetical protein M8C21_002370 [Ambrosia artemisiifolia]|uniref:Non-specific serine/threonine protein kinase n=1 Tax=Ambrosia artemisiifolia TaxID=4212 RepID=A0AAD5CGD6_AMBAR|nr:hypothetical protein M8C21_002370 [Ambrosia artemisiifolia]